MNKYVQDRVNKERYINAKKAATVAYNNVLKINYEWPISYDDVRQRQFETFLNVIPNEFVDQLLHRTLVSKHPHNHKYKEVQEMFDEQFSFYQDATIKTAENIQRQNKRFMIGVAIIACFILVWAGLKIYQQHQQEIYWQNLNTPTVYDGNGYKITFPCSDIKHNSLIKTSDMSTTIDSCTYFGGINHTDIDEYSVEETIYLSTLNAYQNINCAPDNDVDTGLVHNVNHNEKRIFNNTNILICGWDNGVMNAKILNNNTIYTLSALPSDLPTTYQKLNNFLSSFSLSWY